MLGIEQGTDQEHFAMILWYLKERVDQYHDKHALIKKMAEDQLNLTIFQDISNILDKKIHQKEISEEERVKVLDQVEILYQKLSMVKSCVEIMDDIQIPQKPTKKRGDSNKKVAPEKDVKEEQKKDSKPEEEKKDMPIVQKNENLAQKNDDKKMAESAPVKINEQKKEESKNNEKNKDESIDPILSLSEVPRERQISYDDDRDGLF